jgi:hypothetical protein
MDSSAEHWIYPSLTYDLNIFTKSRPERIYQRYALISEKVQELAFTDSRLTNNRIQGPKYLNGLIIPTSKGNEILLVSVQPEMAI